jgi:hypothetical protein
MKRQSMLKPVLTVQGDESLVEALLSKRQIFVLVLLCSPAISQQDERVHQEEGLVDARPLTRYFAERLLQSQPAA